MKNTETELQLSKLLEFAKKDKKAFLTLKNMAVAAQDFELASNLRHMEKELFPETEDQKEAKEIKMLFKLVDLEVKEETCWLANKTLQLYWEKKDKFDLRDAAKLLAEQKKLFVI